MRYSTSLCFIGFQKGKAESIVRQYCHGKGTYLLRPSSNKNESCFAITLSVTPQANIRHLRVNIEQKKVNSRLKIFYFLTSSRKFPTFIDFLRYYCKNSISCDQDITVKLLRGLGYSNRGSVSLGRRLSEPNNSQHFVPTGIAEDRQYLHHHHTLHQLHTISEPDIRSVNRGDFCSLVQSTQSIVGALPPNSSSSGGLNYTNHVEIKKRALTDPKYRPPAPIPTKEDNPYVPTYFEVDENKNFFEETYNFLKETELCECGLRVVDSTLPRGWTVHKCDSPHTGKNIFFQQGEQLTSWDIPQEIVPLLTHAQISFIYQLCQTLGCKIPSNVMAHDQPSVRTSRRSSSRSSTSSHSNSQIQRSLSNGSVTSERSSISSESSTTEISQNNSGSTYETPSPLVVSSSIFFPNSTAATPMSSHAPSLPRVSEDPSSQESDDRVSQESSYSRQERYSYQSDINSSAEGTFSSGSRRPSFNSIPAVTIQAVSGPPSVAPRTKSVRQL
ncbi:hypothetical protein RRG08_018678 [Elysia crispata]|uniref:SH2 domain-containing protein n=1 Tax=Elysia crispata TaxID=231223 RepID=A0AAE1A0U6_9GAST|nr:hypothetical protein RRG08_018678 [Elysia crispata]